jgi:predicted glycogen debranching enzyme
MSSLQDGRAPAPARTPGPAAPSLEPVVPAFEPGAPAAAAAPIELGRDVLGSFEDSARREWLVTNGIGGFAAGSVGLAATRRYHGLLFAALRPPVERVAMVQKLDVLATYGGAEVPLATNEFADGTIAPRGFVQLESFRLDGLIPVWTWLLGDSRLEQRIWMRQGENTTYVDYLRLGGSQQLRLAISPLCTYRDYHWQSRGERPMQVGAVGGGLQIVAFDSAVPYRILCAGAQPTIQPVWYWNFKHRDETARGLDDGEDLLRPAIFEFNLTPGESRSVILTAEPHEPMPSAAAFGAACARQREIAAAFAGAHPARAAAAEFPQIERLALAADQFLVERRDARGTRLGRTVIAGYPWFSDWGRDTMIALPGLTLATGRTGIAASLLRTFAKFVDRGMIPNRFPDAGDAPEYNTVDASLWFFVAAQAYLRATDDRGFAAEIYPVLQDMFDWHVRGTRFQIRMDPADALLAAGEPGVQLTWMDAKVGDWVVTPRIGKAVEINALWFNAVCILRDVAEGLAQGGDRSRYADLAARIQTSFDASFWFEAGGHLYDVIDGPEGGIAADGRRRDASLRPNQLFALSLPHPLLTGARARSVLDACARELWTPVGLRSLAPRDPRYVGRYGGGPVQRDGAYHQGTVWTWLLGPFATAHYRVHADAAAALALLRDIPAHLREGCIGQVSEIMDGDAPFLPQGCFAQAWGVAEILRAWSEINAAEALRQTTAAAATAADATAARGAVAAVASRAARGSSDER